MNRVVDAKVCVMNCPDKEFGIGYMVVRCVNTTLWYYGFYNDMQRAAEVAVELGNGLILGINGKEKKNERCML